MNPKIKGIIAVAMFMAIGIQFVWSFSMTMNNVLPWYKVVTHAKDYVPARFAVEKMYYGKSDLPKIPDSWEVVGAVENNRPARIVYGSLYKPPIEILNENDLHLAFKEGQQFQVLINYSLDYKDPIRVIDFRQNFAAKSRSIFMRCLLYSYGNLAATAAILIGWFWLHKKRAGGNPGK